MFKNGIIAGRRIFWILFLVIVLLLLLLALFIEERWYLFTGLLWLLGIILFRIKMIKSKKNTLSNLITRPRRLKQNRYIYHQLRDV